MARNRGFVDRLRRRRQTRPVIGVVPTIVRNTARFLGGLVKRAGRVVRSIVRR